MFNFKSQWHPCNFFIWTLEPSFGCVCVLLLIFVFKKCINIALCIYVNLQMFSLKHAVSRHSSSQPSRSESLVEEQHPPVCSPGRLCSQWRMCPVSQRIAGLAAALSSPQPGLSQPLTCSDLIAVIFPSSLSLPNTSKCTWASRMYGKSTWQPIGP